MSAKSLELRRAMKQQKPTNKKIKHPLIKYNNLDQIVCIICNTTVKNEIVWNAHLQSRKHKDNVSSLKTNTQESSKPVFKHPLALSESERKDEPVSKKPKNILPSNFFDESTKSGQKQTTEDIHNKNLVKKDSDTIKDDKKLPKGFFDKSVEAIASSTTSDENEEEQKETKEINASVSNESIPEGFFDDPKKDAKARNVEYKDPHDEEWEKFQKMIQEETKTADTIRDAEDEESEMLKDMAELNNMKSCLSRVESLKTLVHKNSKLKQQVTTDSKNIKENEGSDDENCDDDIDGLFDWRAKMA